MLTQQEWIVSYRIDRAILYDTVVCITLSSHTVLEWLCISQRRRQRDVIRLAERARRNPGHHNDRQCDCHPSSHHRKLSFEKPRVPIVVCHVMKYRTFSTCHAFMLTHISLI